MKKSPVVTDASVVIPWLHSFNEPYSTECLRLAQDFRKEIIQIVVPDLLFYELSNFVAIKKNMGVLLDHHFMELLGFDFSVHHLETDEFPEVVSIARRNELSAYDATYFYVAETFDVPLWTTDEKLLKAWANRPGGHIKNYRSQ